MNSLDLDKLKSQWTQESRKLDDSLTFDIAAAREALTRKTATAFRRHSFWQLTGFILSVAGLVALLVFMASNRDEKLYVLMAVPLAMLALGEAITDFREWRIVATLDFSLPTATLTNLLDRVRDRRLRMTKWIILTSILLWWPLILVMMKGLFDIDLLPWIHPSVLIINTLIGLAFIPILFGIMRFISNHHATSPGLQRFLEDVAGKSWSRARRQMDARQRFEHDIATRGNAGALGRFEKKNLLSPSANSRLLALKNRILVSILFYGTLVLSIGIFNAAHGGQWQFIVPGIMLNLFWVSQMVSGITYRISLSRLDLSLPREQLRGDLERLLDMRLVLARVALAASPLAGLAMLQVLAQVTFGIDLLGMIAPYWLLGLIMLLVTSGIAIHKKSGSGTVYAFANIIGLAANKHSKMLTDAMTPETPE